MTESHTQVGPQLIKERTRGAQDAEVLVATLIADLASSLANTFTIIEWAEDEIGQAIGRHRDEADRLYHAFCLIRPGDVGPAMSTEFVYRCHARELLERVAADSDTRPATAAEMCLALAEISLRAPLHSAGAGLYFRMWLRAFPGHPVTTDQAAQQVHYERLHGPRIDELERTLRRGTADPNRRLTDIDCAGRHHGEPVSCRYATGAEPAPPTFTDTAAASPMTRATTSRATRLPDGQLVALLLTHLRSHPRSDFSPHELGRVLGHSHGTIRRHLRRLTESGDVTQTRTRPARFQITS